MTRTLISVFILLLSVGLTGQKRIMVHATDVQEGKKKSIFSLPTADLNITLVSSYCVNYLANHKKFSVIDRQNISIINQEKELQKSEDFIDGYIVDQGKSEGADYVLKPMYVKGEKVLILKVYDVGTETVKCSHESKMETGFMGVKNLEPMVITMLNDLFLSCFDIKYSLVRPIEVKKEEVKTFLVAMGKKQKVTKDDRVEIFGYETETIDGEELSRKTVIGEGVVEEIQDDNFSIVKIKKGGKEISQYLDEKKKVYCIVKNLFD